MTLSPILLAFYLSWGVTVLGVALWVWSWVRVRDPVDRLRFQDCGIVLVFAAILTRVIIQDREMTVFDWAMILLGPLFIAAALWRLSRTQSVKR
ncbi:MAG: hypothetical protein J0I52_09455 [Bordetella sp.]|nr:hypothetical protein [Bordetella sp.]